MPDKNNLSTARSEILNFIEKDLIFAVSSIEVGNHLKDKNGAGATVPSEISPILKRLWLAGKSVRKDIKDSFDYEKGLRGNYKTMSKHKYLIAKNTVKILSEEYIITVMRAHHFFTFLLYPFSLSSEKFTYLSEVVSPENILESNISMTTLLKNEKLKAVFDTDEMAALHSFNYLRNSLAHSADYSAFMVLTPEYYSSIQNLLIEIEEIFRWVATKVKYKRDVPARHKRISLFGENLTMPLSNID